MSVDERILVGQIAGPFGIRGEVKVLPMLARPEVLKTLPAVQLTRPDGTEELRRVVGLRMHQGFCLVAFDGIDRNEAETLHGTELRIRKSEFPPLGDDEFYEWQLLGLAVRTESGRELGVIERVYFYPANDVYETAVALIPAIADVVVRVDLEAGELLVRDVHGLRKDEF